MTVSELITSIISRAQIGWHYVWWSRHVTKARYHDARIESIVPRWRDRLKQD